MKLAENSEILIIKFKSLGDILLSTVLADEIVRQRPDVKVDFLVDWKFEGITKCFPSIRKELIRPDSWGERFETAFEFRSSYDLVIDLLGSTASSLTAKVMSRSGVIGYPAKRASRMYDEQLDPPEPGAHTVDINLQFLKLLELEIPKKIEFHPTFDQQIIDAYSEQLGPKSAIVHPGGRFCHKLWSGVRFGEIADWLISEGYSVHILQGPEDEIPTELKDFRVLRNIGAGELLSVFKGFDLFVGNDSGPMHFAATAGCSVVGIFGPTDPHRWRPYSDRATCILSDCSCGHGATHCSNRNQNWCMDQIQVQDVKTEILKIQPKLAK
ncbi:MAG: glycosyltransferase family 9 protein [Candidatus Lindowbacteria bacterium]|nr:glycosyltransferase family 9 protein [Candidatus Lindowbacteria bacterium]